MNLPTPTKSTLQLLCVRRKIACSMGMQKLLFFVATDSAVFTAAPIIRLISDRPLPVLYTYFWIQTPYLLTLGYVQLDMTEVILNIGTPPNA